MTDTIVLTKEIIRGWTGEEILKAMRSSETRAEIERVMNTPDKTPEEIQAEADAVTAQAEVERVAAEALEAAAAEAARIAAEPVVQPEPVKKEITVEYQATSGPDGTGEPIGRPTKIIGYSLEEVIDKMKKAHINAVQAYERLKAQKVTFKQPEAPAQVGLTEAQIAEIAKELDDDPKKAAKLATTIRKLSNAEELEKQQKELQLREERLRGKQIANDFMRNHIADFNPCEANAKILGDFIRENELEWTVDNLEIAFVAKYSELAPIATVPAVPKVDNPPIQEPVVVAPIAQPVAVQPAVVAPVVVTPVVEPTVNPTTPAHRVPSSGIQPGSLGGRQTPKGTVGLTKQEIAKWTGEQMRAELRKPGRREEINKVLAGN